MENKRINVLFSGLAWVTQKLLREAEEGRIIVRDVTNLQSVFYRKLMEYEQLKQQVGEIIIFFFDKVVIFLWQRRENQEIRNSGR